MLKNHLHSALRIALLGLILAPGVLSAFVLRGDATGAGGSSELTVLRETLETRKTTEVQRAMIAGGAFEVNLEQDAGLFVLRVGDRSAKFVAGKEDVLEVSLGSGELTIAGTDAQADFLAYEAFRKASLERLVYPVRRQLSEARKGNDQGRVEELTRREVAAYNAHKAELNDFTIDQIKGTAALYAASLRWKGDHRLDELEAVVKAYARTHEGTTISTLMLERIGRFRATEIGAVAPILKGESPQGETLSLGDYRGKIVLVDFWAAWCGPCRITNREYVELYSEFKDAGFEIFAVSLDNNKAGWLRGIRQDKATWVHLSDLVGWGSPLAESYNVSSLPSNFLLDREGRIIAKDVDGTGLKVLLQANL